MGRLFSFGSTHDVELKHRVNKRWAKFGMFKEELTDKYYNLGSKLKLFKAVVEPSKLYGCVSWTLTKDGERLLRTVQRKMMRMITAVWRRLENGVLEDWVDRIVRATREAEAIMRTHGIKDWVEEVQRRRSLKWAGHVARRRDGRWTQEVLTWKATGSRRAGQPKTRWTDSINNFFRDVRGVDTVADHSLWMSVAEDRDAWQKLENDY